MIILRMQETMQVDPKQRIHVMCHSGVIWFTRAGEPRDQFLARGDSVDIGPGRIMFTALEPSVMSMSRRADESRASRIGRTLRTFGQSLQPQLRPIASRA